MAEGFHGETEAETRGSFQFGSELGDVYRGGGVDLEYNLKKTDRMEFDPFFVVSIRR